MTVLFGWPPLAKHSEGLTWYTDVLRARNGEQRIALRDAPREDYSYRFPLDQEQHCRFREFVRSVGIDSFWLPVWGEWAHLGAISAHTVTVAVDTTTSSYYAGGYAAIMDCEGNGEVVEIANVASGSLTFDPWIVSAWANAWIAPVRLATFAQPPSVVREVEATHNVEVECRFAVDNVRKLTATGINWQTYLSRPVITDDVLCNSAIEDTHEQERETFDCETAPAVRVKRYTNPVSSSSLAWALHSRSELWNMRNWLHGRQGSRKAMWVPSWNADITITRDITAGDTSVEIEDIGADFIFAIPGVDFIAVATAGTSVCFRVLTCTAGDPGHQLLGLQYAAASSLAVANIKVTCKLTLCRFATDRVEIQHGERDHSEIQIPIVEVVE